MGRAPYTLVDSTQEDLALLYEIVLNIQFNVGTYHICDVRWRFRRIPQAYNIGSRWEQVYAPESPDFYSLKVYTIRKMIAKGLYIF